MNTFSLETGRDLSNQFYFDISNLDEINRALRSSHFSASNWFSLGLQLGLLKPTLDEIEASYGKDIARCLLECLTLWLKRVDKVDKNGQPTWDTLINALMRINENSVAQSISENVKEETLQRYLHTLSQAPFSPIEVSQLLYSESCINERILDEMEMLEVSIENKKTTLLNTIGTLVSRDYKKLKAITSVLSKIEETKAVADTMLSECDLKFSYACHEEGLMNGSSHENSAIYIMQRHYGALSQSLEDPISVARILHEEEILSETVLESIKSTRLMVSERRTVLLRAVRGAVHSSSQNLKVFASVLLKFTDNVPLANAILNDYKISFDKCDSEDKESVSDEDSTTTPVDAEITRVTNTTSSETATSNGILIPRAMGSKFNQIRKKFGSTFYKIRRAILKINPPIEEVKTLLQDSYPDLKSQLAHVNTVDEILNIIRDKCTLIDITYLEVIVETFDIEEAESYIQTYKTFIEEFCRTVSVRLSLDENFKMSTTSSSLKCETATFILDWNPDDCILDDVRDVLSECFESLSKNVQIRVIKTANSISVTCTFPLNLATALIAKALETIEIVKKRGLIRLCVGNCIIFDLKRRHAEVRDLQDRVRYLEEKLKQESAEKDQRIKELTSKFQEIEDSDSRIKVLNKLNKAKSLEIERLTSTLQWKESTDKVLVDKEEIEILHKKITSLILLLREKEDKLSQVMKESQSSISTPLTSKQNNSDHEQSMPSTSQVSCIVTTCVEPEAPEKKNVSNVLTIDKKQPVRKLSQSGIIKWCSNSVELVSPSTKQCEDVMTELKIQQKTRWMVTLKSSSPNSSLIVLRDINNCLVRGLDIFDSHLDSYCVTELSQMLTHNKTMEVLRLFQSPLASNSMELISNAVSMNTTLKSLWLLGDDSITDNDIYYINSMVVMNTTIEELRIYSDNITQITNIDVQQQLTGVLTKNKTLTKLSINGHFFR